MKELPYFKFYPAEYLQGDISFEKLEIQGVFINICSYYWSKNCQVSHEKLLKFVQKLQVSHEKSKKIINILIETKVIKVENDKIVIDFLDEQFNERQAKHKVFSEAGMKGYLTKKEATLKPPLSKKETTLKHLDKDKIKKRKDKDKIVIKPNNSEIVFNSLEELQKELLNSEIWLQELSQIYNIPTEDVVNKLIIFLKEQKADDNITRSLSDIKKHFRNTLKKNIKETKKPTLTINA